jgi:cell division protein FtsQ
MTHTTTYYKTQKIKNRRMLSSRKKVLAKKDLTRIFLACLQGALITLGIASIFLTSIMLYKELLQLPYLQVKKIHVEGCRRQSPANIISLAAINPQINLLSIDLKNMCQRLENSPWIERAQVKRTLPDQLDISIWEREPVALINLNQLHLVDEKGRVFKKAERKDGLTLPILTGITWEDLMSNKKMHTALINQALALMKLFEGEGIPLLAISEIHLDATLGLTVFTTHNATQIEMGFAPFQKKIKRLCTLLEDFKRKNLIPENIDLNYRHKAFIKFKPHTRKSKPRKKGGEQQWEKMEI